MKIKKGDMVKVISGGSKIKGVTGKVLSIDLNKDRVVLEGLPTRKKHLKPEKSRKHPEGGILEIPTSVHISNVMIMSESSNRPVRTGYTFTDGQKVRVARGKATSGETI